MIILDTNVLSELVRPQPSPRVVAWVGGQPGPALFTTSITRGEMLYGVETLPASRRRIALREAIVQIFEVEFANRVLPFDSAASDFYASICAGRRRSGRPIAPFDAQIAAIARSRGAAVATRNVGDFDGAGVDVVDPWST